MSNENGKQGEEYENKISYHHIINSRLTPKDIRDSLWRCRDFELSHFWQRSIMLLTIIVLLYTGYGTVIIKICDSNYISDIGKMYIYNNIAMLLCLLNMVFSILWIMMSKGSKAWYERYENAIEAFENNEEYVCSQVCDGKGLGGFRLENIKGYQKPIVEDCLFKNSGGSYSPSKINIAIGQITLILWIASFCVHYFIYSNDFRIGLGDIVPHMLLLMLLMIILYILYLTKLPAWSLNSSIFFWLKSNIIKENGIYNKCYLYCFFIRLIITIVLLIVFIVTILKIL